MPGRSPSPPPADKRKVEQRIRVARYNRRLRTSVADELNTGGKIAEVFRIAHVSVKELDTVVFKNADVSFGTATHQIVQGGYLVPLFPKMHGNMRAKKTAPARYENVQKGPSELLGGSYGLFSFFVVAAAEILFQPHIQADKKVPAAHLFDRQLGSAGVAISPGNRHDGPTVAANNRLQGQFDS